MKYTLFLCFLLTCTSACSKNSHEIPDGNPVKPEEPEETTVKPKYLWFDAEANFTRFATQDSIRYYLDKTKETGFTHIVVDVRPIYGQVLYKKTTTMQQLTKVGGKTVNRDWDYLQFFIDESKKRDLKVVVSTTFFPAGNPVTKEGLVYEDAEWAKKTTKQWTPKGYKDIKDDPTKVAAFLNPALPEVQELALTFVKEIVSNYEIDGYALDYCRYPDVQSDFSDESRAKFEAYIGKKLTNFPNDIFSWNGTERVDGPYAKKWFEFRSMIIHDFIKKTREEIKSIKPDVNVELWSPSWYGALYENGQNWASTQYNPAFEYYWASPEYYKTGFAELLDIFLLGTYLDIVYGKDEPESIEYGIARAKRIIKNGCTIYGTIDASKKKDVGDAATVCLEQTEGLMVFDIVHVINNNWWGALKNSISKYSDKYEKK